MKCNPRVPNGKCNRSVIELQERNLKLQERHGANPSTPFPLHLGRNRIPRKSHYTLSITPGPDM